MRKTRKKRVKKPLTPRQEKIAKLMQQRGTVAQFARDLSKICGREVSWETAYNWIRRGGIPKQMVLHVHKLTGAPLEELLK